MNAVQRELKFHKLWARQFYDNMTHCENLVKGEERGISEMITFDFMQNIPVPHIPVPDMLYWQQPWVYIFGILKFSDNKAFIYMYDEITAKKGPDEVVSLLMDFIMKHVAPSVKTLYAFSDACTGQNRNRTMVQFWYTLVHSGRLSNVRHMYPTRGHSYNACDRDFTSLELRKRKQDTLYTPYQWFTMLRTARKHMHLNLYSRCIS